MSFTIRGQAAKPNLKRMKFTVKTPLLVLLLITLAACERESSPTTTQPRPHLVEVVEAQRIDLSVRRERTGTLRAIQEIQIFTQEEGQITELPFFEGDRVKRGEVIAKLDDRLLRAQLNRALALQKKSETDLNRIRDLVERRLTTAAELTQIETDLAIAQADVAALETRLGFLTLRSPIDGVVTERRSEPGNIADRYAHIMTLADQQTLITEVRLSELLLNHLSVGDTVELYIDALRTGSAAQTPLYGEISRIYPDIDPMTRTGTVEIALHPVPLGARAGQFVRVILQTQRSERLLIPFIALRRSTAHPYVFIIDDDNRAQTRAVQTGLEIGDQIEILEGLEPGERLVIRGFTNLRDNQQVTIVGSASNGSNR
ncbi:RND family efflux transporter MFP subunit [Methylophaga lonarensis MPL]|uniref:RND family efflux transporter MFP subunit n=3 Tax=Methylophaga lonarensis TaxID=999151 RepID=M7PUV1_9GAMM|nr:RND family efflux transporter MFP subunit [Methylophaga lonarensis MPL]